MSKRLGLAGLILIGLATSAHAKKKPEPTGLELQQIQSRDFEVPKSVSFPAVMSTLQDAGYRIGNADVQTGLITASASTKSKLTWMPFVGFGRSKKTPVVSAYIEDRGRSLSRVRLSFVMGKVVNNAEGARVEDEEPILDPVVYQEAFEKIGKEVFVRQAMDAPPPPQPAASAVAQPAAQPVPQEAAGAASPAATN